MEEIRINRALASAGVASRRKAEQWVLDGRVQVNGVVVRDLAVRIDPEHDLLAVDGKELRLQGNAYYLYYKPRGVISTLSDESNRECLGDLCKGLAGNPRPVGRLDRKSEGLMLLTNDGQLANQLMHPRYGVQKEYLATVSPPLKSQHAARLVGEVELEDGPAKFVGMEMGLRSKDRVQVLVTVAEGRNRLVRRMFEHFNYSVKRLLRIKIGNLELGKLKPGEHRKLSGREVKHLKQSVGN